MTTIDKIIINNEIIIEEIKNNYMNYDKVVKEILNCNGKIIVVSIGKSGHVAKKFCASLSSLGKASFFVHAAEAAHGDLGMIQSSDLVLLISNSGETGETLNALNYIKLIGAKTIGVSANQNSTLLSNTDLTLVYPKVNEIDQHNLAPTSSTIALMYVLDYIAVEVSSKINFKKEQFGNFHPGGALGKKVNNG